MEHELATFRRISDYARIANEAVYGNFDHATDNVLYEQALPIVQRLYDDERRRMLAKCESLAGTELASNNIERIVSAAHEGRIDSLVVDYRTEVYGRFDAHINSVQFVNRADPELDLIELATAQTVLHNGSVYAVAQSDLASASPLCALFRY